LKRFSEDPTNYVLKRGGDSIVRRWHRKFEKSDEVPDMLNTKDDVEFNEKDVKELMQRTGCDRETAEQKLVECDDMDTVEEEIMQELSEKEDSEEEDSNED
jgi:NACalpha-BTF3-like transcription factor